MTRWHPDPRFLTLRRGRALVLAAAVQALLLALLVILSSPARGEDGAVWPLSPVPEVAEVFAPPEITWGAGHRGVDLLGRPGAPVRAAMSGRVSFVGSIAGRGVVVVDHGATRTTYEPVAATVPRGATVTAGDVIGSLLRHGSHCAPRTCLHWGWKRGETYLDPLDLVDGPRPVRLWPAEGPPPADSPTPTGGDGDDLIGAASTGDPGLVAGALLSLLRLGW